jgi:hypothetical protein
MPGSGPEADLLCVASHLLGIGAGVNLIASPREAPTPRAASPGERRGTCEVLARDRERGRSGIAAGRRGCAALRDPGHVDCIRWLG